MRTDTEQWIRYHNDILFPQNGLITFCKDASADVTENTFTGAFMRLVIAIGVSTICLAGCASITKGTDQNGVINTNPQGARCELVREGDVLAVVDPTPGTIVLD